MGYVDRRDWPSYNEALVKRGELFLELDAVEGWQQELDRMNRDKEGGRYRFPDGFIQLLGFIRYLFHLPYRQTEGFVKALSRYMPKLEAPDYSTLNRRLNSLHLPLELEDMEEGEEGGGEPVVIAVDASGVKVTNRGEWLRRRMKTRKGYLKVHFAVDVKRKEVVSLKVTSEKTGDNRMFKPLVKAALKRRRVLRVLADGAYDAKENFNWLAERGVEAAVRLRRSSAPRSRGSMHRKLAVAERLKDPEGWKRRYGYGYRWAVEGAFSRFKRLFGEYVSARKFRNMVKEVVLKASLLNLLTRLAAPSVPAAP